MAERTPGRTTSRAGSARGAAARRRALRKSLSDRTGLLREIVRRPELGGMVLLAIAFAVLGGLAGSWAHDRMLIARGRVSDTTHLVRHEFTRIDAQSTDNRRELERQRAPRAYAANAAMLDELQNALRQLPLSLVEAQTLGEVAIEIREQYQLTPESFASIRSFARDEGTVDRAWVEAVQSLIAQLSRTPILDREAMQVEQISPNELIAVRSLEGPISKHYKGRARSVGSERLPDEMRRLVREAGFPPEAVPSVVARLTQNPRPTMVYDETLTQQLRDEAAERVQPDTVTYKAGDVLLRRGEPIETSHVEILESENREYLAQRPSLLAWLQSIGMIGLFGVVAIGASLYITLFYPPSERRPARLVILAAITLGLYFAALWGGVLAPSVLLIVATAPTILLGVLLVTVFDQRVALLGAALHGLLIAIALQQPVSFYLATLAGSAAAISQLAEIRARTALIRAGFVTAVAGAVTVGFVELFERPLGAPGIVNSVVMDMAQIAFAGVVIGFVSLGVLPLIERVFDVTTGMTLIELRDPRQPLLRRLAQRAPGTYTHSMTVASLAETAADAVGADGLHVYVGALYHDIGKMNKPDYFVENQSGGFNRHSKLSPAMSLLVIVGHVKDGIETARDAGLPRSLRHYIESHHGTTLVEYFYHRAKEQADETKGDAPAEIGYRYPGPKPRTKEAAILMLCDAVESATRALAEPTPSRIENVVRTISLKRLMDGQFDECDLTLRELNIIEDAVIKSLNSIYHGRIAYPSGAGGSGEDKPRTAPGAAPATGTGPATAAAKA